MADNNDDGALTLKQRLRCLLAATDEEAEALLRAGRTGVDTAGISRRIRIGQEQVNRLVESRTTIEQARIDVNNVTSLQLSQVPRFSQDRIRMVMEGRPYFSLREFEAASGLAPARAKELFHAPDLEFVDKITGATRRFEPVFGHYLAYPRGELESTEMIEALGFAERPTTSTGLVRLIEPSETEALQKSHLLKQALGGLVFPVLSDAEGFERYIIPATIDVWFDRDVPPSHALKLLGELGLRINTRREKVGYYQVEIGDWPDDFHVTAATLRTIQQLHQHSEIRFAEPAEVGLRDFQPANEKPLPDFESASSGSRTWNLEAIDIDAAHAITQGSPDVTLLIVDSGIRADHQDLAEALRPDWVSLDLNFDVGVPEAELSPVERTIAHGTKVASVAAGRAPVGESRVRGVAPGCFLLPVKISGFPFGQSYGLRAVAIQEAIDYIEPGKRGVINLSWSTNGEHIGVREALFDASARGLAITTSAGNYQIGDVQLQDKPHYPSQYALLPGDTQADIDSRRKIPGLAAVAAVDASDRKATYSYYGSHSVTVSAPGGEPGFAGTGVFVANTPTDYAYDAGTSFAAPHVAGLIGLIWSVKPTLTSREVIDTIRSTATDLDARNPDFAGMLGSGLINARAALESLGLASSAGATVTSTTPAPDTSGGGSGDGRININTATAEELAELPYIGGWSAAMIVNYRTVNGPFATIWDLTLTGALDHWTVEQIEHLISVGPGPVAGPGTSSEQSPEVEKAAGGKLNINAATVQELDALPFIGFWSASAIVKYRDIHGPFSEIWDLTLTQAIDRWAIAQIEPLIIAG